MNIDYQILYSQMLGKEFFRICEQYGAIEYYSGSKLNDFRRKVMKFLVRASELFSEGKCDAVTFKEIVKKKLKTKMPLEIPWFLHVNGILSLEEFLLSSCLSWVGPSFFDTIHQANVGKDVLADKMCCECLKIILLNMEKTETAVSSVISEIIQRFDDGDLNFLVKTLSEISTDRPMLLHPLGEFLNKVAITIFTSDKQTNIAIYNQQESLWQTLTVEKYKSLFDLLCKTKTKSDNLIFIEKTFLEVKSSINWAPFLSFLVCFKDGKSDLKVLLHNLLKISLDKSDEELLTCVFITARFCCLHMKYVFKSYLQWFASTFSSDSSRPINSTQKANFFMAYLTQIIEHDQTYFLKVHINRIPKVPVECHSLLSDYVTIVKTRLMDMNEDTELGFFENDSSLNSVKYDLQMFLTYFSDKNEIPGCILEGSVFHKAYYEKKFLTELLSRFDGSRSIKHKAILKLHSLGKIPNSLYVNYKMLVI